MHTHTQVLTCTHVRTPMHALVHIPTSIHKHTCAHEHTPHTHTHSPHCGTSTFLAADLFSNRAEQWNEWVIQRSKLHWTKLFKWMSRRNILIELCLTISHETNAHRIDHIDKEYSIESQMRLTVLGPHWLLWPWFLVSKGIFPLTWRLSYVCPKMECLGFFIFGHWIDHHTFLLQCQSAHLILMLFARWHS